MTRPRFARRARMSSLTSGTKTALVVGLFLLLVFVAQGIFFIRANSQTVDEVMHLAAGYSYLSRRDFRLEPQNPPLIKEFLALPLFLAYGVPFG
jgi:hypothetical protein